MKRTKFVKSENLYIFKKFDNLKNIQNMINRAI